MLKSACDPCPICGAPQCAATRLPLLAIIVRCAGTCPQAGPVIHCQCDRSDTATRLARSI